MKKVIEHHFKDRHQLYFHSSDRHHNIEGDTYLRYELNGEKADLYIGGNGGEICVICTSDTEKLDSLIKIIVYG